MIDTHVHYASTAYSDILPNVKQQDLAAGIEKVLCLPIRFEDNFSLIENTRVYDGMYYAAGIHPLSVPDYPSLTDTKQPVLKLERMICEKRIEILDDFQNKIGRLKTLIEDDPARFIAVGETGIDTHTPAGRNNLLMQKISFREHIILSLRTRLPLVLHLRGEDALDEALGIMNAGSLSAAPLRGVWHCFHGTAGDMHRILSDGKNDFLFGIGAILTYPERGMILRRTLKESGEDILSRLVLETDSPYLPPASWLSHDPSAVNTSSSLPEVVRLMSELLGVPEAVIRDKTTRNAERMFGFSDSSIDTASSAIT